MRGTRVRYRAIGFAALLVAVSPARGAPPPAPGDSVEWAEVARARAYFRAIQADSALPVAEAVLRSPAAARDPALAREARLLQGSSLATLSRASEAEPVLSRSVREAEAAGDSARLGQALRYLAYSLGMLGRGTESAATYRRLLGFSLARADTLNEAYARLGLAYQDLLAGRFVEGERGYERAIPLFRAKREDFLVRNSTVGLGRCLEGQDRLDDARRCYRQVDSLCQVAGDVYNRSAALNNLGAIEHMTGDLATAEADYRAAYDLYRMQTSGVGAVPPACNLALVQMEMGHLDDAEVALGEALSRARRAGYRQGEAEVLERSAELKVAQRQYPKAVEHIRAGLALADSLPRQQRIGMIVTFARALALVGERPEAIRILERGSSRIAGDVSSYSACELELELSTLLRDAGRADAALGAARRAVSYAQRGESLDLLFRARVKEGLALQSLGRNREARVILENASAVWEANRGRQQDPEAREYLSTTARECVSGLIETYAAEDAPCGQVFAAIERFKARTLRERMVGPWKSRAAGDTLAPSISLEAFQRSVLRDGELLLQTFIGPSAGVIVAVTPRQCRIVSLPVDGAFRDRLRRLRSLAAAPHPAEADLRFLDQAGRRIGETLLAPVRDLVADARRVIVSPDEELGLMPWAMLVLPTPGDTVAAPLIEAREVVLAPSANIFVDLRRLASTPCARHTTHTLALAGAPPVGGAALPGAWREVRWLHRRFANVDARDSAPELSTRSHPGLESYDVLHLAAHTSLDDQHPWRSGIRIGAAGGSRAEEYLRADRIASMRLRARLAVLSSCESAGGRINSGEGVQSLSAAFVSAGVTTTVATLWPVSDRTTELFMQCFYRRLAAGGTVAAALRDAQLEIRSHPATRHPFYWAGFIVLGDGDVRVPLRGRFPAAPAAAAVTVAGCIALFWRWRDQKSRLTNAGEGTLNT